ncbi:metallocarboxypeptidase D [Flavobacteriaceae bacterium UJ101]|nr:metallocarboxypeptidase D [Flavobacteriaceae bacterium UJ101]
MKFSIKNYSKYKEEKIHNRLIDYKLLCKLLVNRNYLIIGQSVEGRNIHMFEFGKGEKKVMLWTQMHGNEATGTNAIFDLINLLEDQENPYAKKILERLTLQIIPMVNPDGTELIQRRNAMHIDINRDFIKKQAPETQVLQKAIDNFNPLVCFNLHDQRTIFNVEGTSNPATISFLAPSEDKERTVTNKRKQTMGIISAMNKELQEYAYDHVGRYTDEFYPNAFGDNLQKKGYCTVLIEAGGSKNDLERQHTRYLNWISLIAGLDFISKTDDLSEGYEEYNQIPQNDQKMLDVVYRNVKIKKDTTESIVDLGIMLNEKLNNQQRELVKNPRIEQIGDLDAYFGYEEIDAEGKMFSVQERHYPILNESADFELI